MHVKNLIPASILTWLLLLSLLSTPVVAEEAVPASEQATAQTAVSLDEDIQSLKKDVLALNRELFILEEELLYPANTQVAVFLSLDVGKYFELNSVQLKIDDKVVTNYLYTSSETDALIQGGVQRLYMGNLKAGEHELVAIFTGKGPNGREYRRGAEHVVNKSLGARFVELKIVDNNSSEQPDFSIKEWE